MPATTTKMCDSCREKHVFFLQMGSAAEFGKKYEYICPRNRSRVQFQPVKSDVWTRADVKIPGLVIVREVIARS
jgi:hypothetical protein